MWRIDAEKLQHDYSDLRSIAAEAFDFVIPWSLEIRALSLIKESSTPLRLTRVLSTIKLRDAANYIPLRVARNLRIDW